MSAAAKVPNLHRLPDAPASTARETHTYRATLRELPRPVCLDVSCSGIKLSAWFSLAEARATAADLLAQCDAFEADYPPVVEVAA